jgi:alkylation response protein AidB-like acyl-CoA dehydrogenase
MSMEFEWTQEQKQLRTTVSDYCRKTADARARHADDQRPDLTEWRQLGGELGIAGLAVDPRYGGSGASVLELGIVAEQFGRHLVSGPFLATAGLVLPALSALADDAVNKEVLPSLLSGEQSAALVVNDEGGGLDPDGAPLKAFVSSSGDVTLSGASSYVLGGADADVLLCLASLVNGERGLFLVTSSHDGLTRTLIPGLDTGLRQARLDFDRVPARQAGDPAAVAQVIDSAIDAATVLVAADQVGVAQAMLDASVAYAGTRLQFGRQIGSFQAVRHRCADMYLAVELARATAYHALWALAEDLDEHAISASLAHVVCSDNARKVTSAAIQIHGGVGFTWEHPVHRYFKRAASNAALIGGHRFHSARLASRALGDRCLAVSW